MTKHGDSNTYCEAPPFRSERRDEDGCRCDSPQTPSPSGAISYVNTS